MSIEKLTKASAAYTIIPSSAVLLAFVAGMLGAQEWWAYKLLGMAALFVLYFMASKTGKMLSTAACELREISYKLEEGNDQKEAALGLAIELEELQRK